MKELPSEEKLAELVERARVVAQKARQLDEMSDRIARKWNRRREAKEGVQQ